MKTARSARCPICGSQELLTVTMTPHGDTISFTLCNACGWKGWGRGGESVLLSSVRPLIGKRLPDSEILQPTGTRAAGRQGGGTDERRRSGRTSGPARPPGGARRKRPRRA